MKKYTEDVKIKAVSGYFNGEGSLRDIAKTYQVDFSSLRIWVAAYRKHGTDGLRSRENTRRTFTQEFKLGVLNRMVKEGLSSR